MWKKKVVRIQILGLSGFFERKEFIPIVFVLFFSCIDFCGDALRKVVFVLHTDLFRSNDLHCEIWSIFPTLTRILQS